MFNSGRKKEAIAELKRAKGRHDNQLDSTVKLVEKFHEAKKVSVRMLTELADNVERFEGEVPYTIAKKIEKVKVAITNFNHDIAKIESEADSNVGAGVAGAGVAAGVGVAAFGPTAAMAIATTFGTASTGTAIATLSGAAATNAALAWLGGGALVAGGGGIAAGEALLAMAGPVGWAIGGLALVGGGLLANSKNKKAAEEAESKTREIDREVNKLKKIESAVRNKFDELERISNALERAMLELDFVFSHYTHWTQMSDHDMEMIGVACDEGLSLAELVNEKLNVA